MAIFPSLKPATRTFTPGRYPHSEISTLSGLQTRVRSSNVLLEQSLRLTFAALTETEMLSIRSHYIGQQGRFLSFVIPNELLSGTTTPASFTPTGHSWIYASRPTITDIGLQRYDVSVELSTVPAENANLSGAGFTVTITVDTGTPPEGDRNYGLITEAVDESLDYLLVTAAVTSTEDWGTIV